MWGKLANWKSTKNMSWLDRCCHSNWLSVPSSCTRSSPSDFSMATTIRSTNWSSNTLQRCLVYNTWKGDCELIDSKYSLYLRLPHRNDAKTMFLTPLCYILVYNFITRPSFKNLNVVFFHQVSIDAKSVLTFEKCPLVAEMKLKWCKMADFSKC